MSDLHRVATKYRVLSLQNFGTAETHKTSKLSSYVQPALHLTNKYIKWQNQRAKVKVRLHYILHRVNDLMRLATMKTSVKLSNT